jgi:hypothetical protein
MNAQSPCDIAGCPAPDVVQQVASLLGSPLSAPTRCGRQIGAQHGISTLALTPGHSTSQLDVSFAAAG